MTTYYPAFLDIRGRWCVVVGGGEVAERKVRMLLECGAQVNVISPQQSRGINELATQGAIRVEAHPFRPEDLEGASLVIAATDDQKVNQQVAAEAKRRNLLVNVVDMPAQGNFIVPSLVQRGDLTIAISTGGHSPALARKLREELEQKFGPEYATLLQLISQVRRDLMAQGKSTSPEAWQTSLDKGLLELVRRGETELARKRLLSSLEKGARPNE